MTTMIGLAVVLVLTDAITVHPARAGTYVMRNCNVPGHPHSLLHPWRLPLEPQTTVVVADGCAVGSGFAVKVGESRQLSNGDGQSFHLGKPTGSGNEIRFVKLVIWYAARLAGSGNVLQFTTHDRRSSGETLLGLFNTPPGSEHFVAEHMLSPETTSVGMTFQCGPWGVPQPEPCSVAHDVPFLLRGTEVTLSEDVPPIVLPLTGTLLGTEIQSGVRTLAFSASDAQSGLSRVDVLLGETVVASHDLSPRCPHSDFTVCPASEDATLQVDTRAVANGRHLLTLRALDAAGNERVVHGERAVEVGNLPSPVAVAVPAPASPAAAYAISARLKGTSKAALTVPFGRRMSLSGRLTHGAQAVAPGATVEVLERLDRRGAREIRRARVKTRANGRFSAVLSTRRPSRRIRLAYRPAGGGRVVSRTLRLRVRAASSVRASLRGRVLHFSGTVRSGPMPKGGKRVVMEGRSPGSAWTPFRSLRTNAKGRFSDTYRLRVHRPGVRLRVRAVVRSEGGYGYLSSRSRAVTLRVR